MNRICVLVLLLALPGCSSAPPKKHAPPEPNPNYPVIFKIDKANPPPMMEILATATEILRLRELYASFFLEMGNPEKGPMQSFQHDRKGSLELPWRFYLPLMKTPYVIRLIGVLPNGTREVIHEETY